MLRTNEIWIRDPYIVAENEKYYLFGTRGETSWGEESAFYVYTGTDLEHWDGPETIFTAPEGFWATKHFWAPEVHKYKEKYYMFASFRSETRTRGTQILVSDAPDGPFTIHSGDPVTPEEDLSLDGTLWVENGVPYMVYCHGWTQIGDGRMCLIPLREDLTAADGPKVHLFCASEAPWTRGWDDDKNFVTDGPFLYSAKNGDLLMLWSSVGEEGYAMGYARSQSGSVLGPWEHMAEPIFKKDGGHSMIFKTLEGRLMITLHCPNTGGLERPVFLPLKDENGILSL